MHKKDTTTFAWYYFTYDAADRVTSFTNSNTANSSDTATYTYDNQDQLLGADRLGTTSDELYAYDSAGNRTSVNGQGVTPDANNRLTNDGTFTYTYDDEGNRLTKTRISSASASDKTTEYTWDNRNRLIKVTLKNNASQVTKTVDYAYDAFDQLIERTVDPDGPGTAAVDQAFYLYDQGQVVLEFDKSGSGSVAASNLSHRYLWGAAVDELLADEQVTSLASAGQTLWAMTDQEGTVRDLLDNSGRLRLHRNFDAYGNVQSETHYNASGSSVTAGQTGFVTLVFGFTGRFLDSVTGLQNNHERWYDPKTGKFASEDPLGFAAGDANLTRYVGNSPTNATDPSGLFDFPYLITGNPDVWNRIWDSLFPPYSPVTVQLPDGTIVTAQPGTPVKLPDGRKMYILSEPPSSCYANQALLLAPILFKSASIPGERPLPIRQGPPGFSNPAIGNEMHSQFGDVLTARTGTSPKDWTMRTAPGQHGVDASYKGPQSCHPGFEHAELKPFTQNGFDKFMDQLDRWNLPPGDTQLWWYDKNGDIWSSGHNY